MQSVSIRRVVQSGGATADEVFVDELGQPMKFRLQVGLSSALTRRLEDGITSCGGLVVTKIPVRGLVVIDPRSRVGRDLVLEWAWNERPGRRFVSFDFVLRCIDLKQLLPIDDEARRWEKFVADPRAVNETQAELSREANDKLALYLATAMPSTTGARSSNIVYQHLVKNRRHYPWVRDYHWKAFRNHYCKNKKYYDRLISAIVKQRGEKLNSKARSLSQPTPDRPFLVAKRPVNSSSAVVEVVLPIRNKPATENRNRPKKKAVKFNRQFLIERKRKFGNDVTNTTKARTIDDMLKAPLPPVIASRPSKRFLNKQVEEPSLSDIEIGRAPSRGARSEIWIDDHFKQPGEEEIRVATPAKMSCLPNIDRFQESFSFYGLDLDDLRSAVALDKMEDDTSEVELEDETSVAELLGLRTTASGRLRLGRTADTLADGAAGLAGAINEETAHLTVQHPETLEMADVLELAQHTRFTIEEISQKLAGFSGDMEKTRDFFFRCRQLVDDLFAGNSNAQPNHV